MRFLSTIFILLISITIGFSQTAIEKKLPKIDDAFNQKQYSLALTQYVKLYPKITDNNLKVKVAKKQAVCYTKLLNYTKAADMYKQIIELKLATNDVHAGYANSLKSIGKYDEAVVAIKASSDSALVKKFVADIEAAGAIIDKPTRHKVVNASPMNSKSNDFAPAYADKKYKVLSYSSCDSRKESEVLGKKPDPRTGERYPDMFSIKYNVKKDEYTDKVHFIPPFSTEFGESQGKSDLKLKNLYYVRYSPETGYTLYSGTKLGLAWDKGEVPPIPNLNDTTYISAPCVSYDHLNLYFAANLEGGYGGTDIWVVSRRRLKSMWIEKPVNLGPEINTAGDEDYPFFAADSSLYFSSNGHGGLGGMDIFRAERADSKGLKFKNPVNLGSPINSSSEDLGLIREARNDRGYFASNRKVSGAQGGLDIYSFNLPDLEYTLFVTVVDSETKAVIPGAYVKVKVGPEATNDAVADDAGSCSFDKSIIKKNSTYEVVIGKLGINNEPEYEEVTKTVTTVGVTENPNIYLNVEIDLIK